MDEVDFVWNKKSMPESSNALFTGCRVKPGMTMGMMSVHRWTPFWNVYLAKV
jgi:hypothetical protein